MPLGRVALWRRRGWGAGGVWTCKGGGDPADCQLKSDNFGRRRHRKIFFFVKMVHKTHKTVAPKALEKKPFRRLGRPGRGGGLDPGDGGVPPLEKFFYFDASLPLGLWKNAHQRSKILSPWPSLSHNGVCAVKCPYKTPEQFEKGDGGRGCKPPHDIRFLRKPPPPWVAPRSRFLGWCQYHAA